MRSMPNRSHVAQRLREPDGVGDVAGAGLELASAGPDTATVPGVTSAIMLPPPCHGGVSVRASSVP